MIPVWLEPSPNGLSEAERRALEAFFVAEDVKAAADLVRLAPKTIQNELLLARQTMGESKSWMAAIRYVFHVKRQGYAFVETPLIPKIDRQIRRLIDDYLEATEASAPQASIASGTVLAGAAEASQSPHSSREILSTEDRQHNLVSEEKFEAQLRELANVAASVYTLPIKRRRKRTVLLVAALALASVAGWSYLNGKDDPIDPSLPSVENLSADLAALQDSTKGRRFSQSDRAAYARLTDQLCGRYQEDRWGPVEPAVIKLFETYKPEIESGTEWARENDKAMALRIFGNGHRAFKLSGLLWGKWYVQLKDVIKGNQGDDSVYMVRALCGQIFGALNSGKAANIPLSPEEATADQEEAVKLLERLPNLNLHPEDHANALRHIGMTKNPGPDASERIEYCRNAMRIYEGLPNGAQARRGVAQCMLSIAQSATDDPFEHLSRAADAYPKVRDTGNLYMVKECIEREILASYHAALKIFDSNSDPYRAKVGRLVLGRTRAILWEYAESCARSQDASGQMTSLYACLDIDERIARDNIPKDIQELLTLSMGGQVNLAVRKQLTGYVLARFSEAKVTPNLQLSQWATATEWAEAIRKGGQLSDAEAVRLIRSRILLPRD